jgi:hypothetical protein
MCWRYGSAAGHTISAALPLCLHARHVACTEAVADSLLTAMGVQVGYFDITSAAMPEMCGALMLVPERHSGATAAAAAAAAAVAAAAYACDHAVKAPQMLTRQTSRKACCTCTLYYLADGTMFVHGLCLR